MEDAWAHPPLSTESLKLDHCASQILRSCEDALRALLQPDGLDIQMGKRTQGPRTFPLPHSLCFLVASYCEMQAPSRSKARDSGSALLPSKQQVRPFLTCFLSDPKFVIPGCPGVLLHHTEWGYPSHLCPESDGVGGTSLVMKKT